MQMLVLKMMTKLPITEIPQMCFLALQGLIRPKHTLPCYRTLQYIIGWKQVKIREDNKVTESESLASMGDS